MRTSTDCCAFASVRGASALAADVLHRWEWARLETLRAAHRRDTFVAGRVAAKRLLAPAAMVAPADLAIVSWDRHGRSSAPLIWSRGRLLRGRLSIAHDDHRAVAWWSHSAETIRGVDLSDPHGQLPPSPLYFGNQEREHLERLPQPQRRRTAARWFAAKEAGFKTLGARQFAPRRFVVREPTACSTRSTQGTITITQFLVGTTDASLLTVAERSRSPVANKPLLSLALQNAAEPIPFIDNRPHHD